MAKATATCTCAKCGATFTRTKICCNRRDADSWEEWAAANFDECDACYTARKASEREAAAALLGDAEKRKDEQVNLFDYRKTEIINELQTLDVMALTPMDAINKLFLLREKARKL